VIERSPPHLLHEIILVDDGSNAEHIGQYLADYVSVLPVPVKIVRQNGRTGLMRARVAGAKVATGETLTFLDSHIDCSEGWLDFLMARIGQFFFMLFFLQISLTFVFAVLGKAEDPKHAVMPIIDSLSRNFVYSAGGIELVPDNFFWKRPASI
jgi:glycosyltransferase involved in cell wall biosynthesis